MQLIVFSGLPGTGKSSIAEAVARELGIPVFAKDWLEATLIRCELKPAENGPPLGSAGYQLLTTLAERQLQLGQSVILDSVASTLSIRAEWRALAKSYQAAWWVIECICSDEAAHRDRLGERQRGIPGWHELDWSEVERVKAYYAPWNEERLILDAVEPLAKNIAAALQYVRPRLD
jgi:predicted kinase